MKFDELEEKNVKSITWQSPIRQLYKGKKVPKSVEQLEQVGIQSLIDLAWIFPHKYYPVKRDPFPEDCQENDYVQISGHLKNLKTRPIFARKIRMFNLNALLMTDKGAFRVTWFNAYPNMVSKIKTKFQNQSEITLEGNVGFFGASVQLTNPKFNDNEIEEEDKIFYPTVNKVKGTFIEKLIAKIPVELYETIPEIPGRETLKNSLLALHNKNDQMKPPQALKRIKYQEFFLDQLKAMIRREVRNSRTVDKISIDPKKYKEILQTLPYELTDDQDSCLRDIMNDLNLGYPISRLVQGDVGCGKTTIAQISAQLMIDKGFQVAFMAPTENLAKQHYQNLKDIIPGTILLTSSLKTKEKREVLKKIASGEATLAVGTHSLFQAGVEFKNLGFSIIDEQHKFGVNQRISLINKAVLPHCLLMTATPIPRTLRLTQFRDLDVSVIKQMPGNRKKISTRIVNHQNIDKYLSFLKTRVDMGEQVYIVLPNIEKSERRDSHSLEEILEEYKKFFPSYKIAAVHGKMDSEDSAAILNQFREKKVQILISTTVIEVGIHIANATVMAIYNPELFGLSSLHQLRGRVGRGGKPGFCFLVNLKKINETQLQRLKTFEKEHDGFKISEHDLAFRGEGDLFGAQQSGFVLERRISHYLEDNEIFDNVIEDFEQFSVNREILENQARFFNLYENDYINKYI